MNSTEPRQDLVYFVAVSSVAASAHITAVSLNPARCDLFLYYPSPSPYITLFCWLWDVCAAAAAGHRAPETKPPLTCPRQVEELRTPDRAGSLPGDASFQLGLTINVNFFWAVLLTCRIFVSDLQTHGILFLILAFHPELSQPLRWIPVYQRSSGTWGGSWPY